MLQLLYVSSAKPGAMPVDVDALLAQSRRNNTRDEITGLLYTDDRRFLQVLEGPKPTVEDTFLRIIADPRHHALVLLSRREITSRESGEWSMATRTVDQGHDAFMSRIADLTRDADASVRGTFAGLIESRRAALRSPAVAGPLAL